MEIGYFKHEPKTYFQHNPINKEYTKPSLSGGPALFIALN